MELPRRRPEPAAIDITWVSCRGVKSSLPFHKPCLYASIFVVSSSATNAQHRRRHRVKTPTDRDGGENPEWDAPLRLYLPRASPSPQPDAAGSKNNNSKDDGSISCDDTVDDVLLVRFELKAEVAVLGDVNTASAAVPVPDLVADGRTRRVSYQLVGPDGRQPNGVISFSYAFHERNGDDDGQSSSSYGSEPATPPACCSTPAAVAVSPATIITAARPRLYPEIEWTLRAEQPLLHYPPVTAKDFTIADAQCYPPPPPRPAPSVEPASVYPPALPVKSASIYPAAPPEEPASVYPAVTETSFRSVYPTVVEPAGTLYPRLDLAPVSYYPPAPAHGVAFGYGPPPGWADRCLYG